MLIGRFVVSGWVGWIGLSQQAPAALASCLWRACLGKEEEKKDYKISCLIASTGSWRCCVLPTLLKLFVRSARCTFQLPAQSGLGWCCCAGHEGRCIIHRQWVGAMLGLASWHHDGLLPTNCSVACKSHKTTPSFYCYHICIFLRILLHMPVLAEILRTVTKVPVLLLWTAWLRSSGHWSAQTQGCFRGFCLIPSHLL